MRHEEKIKELMSCFDDKFYYCNRLRKDRLTKVSRCMTSLAMFKEEQFRILIENKLQDFERKEYHGDPTTNEIAIIGARIFADDLLSELKEEIVF